LAEVSELARFIIKLPECVLDRLGGLRPKVKSIRLRNALSKYPKEISTCYYFDLLMITLRRIAILLFATWLVLVLLGKGGFVHLLLLNAIGVGFVDLIGVVRQRMTVEISSKRNA
jgi:hypothetical protein